MASWVIILSACWHASRSQRVGPWVLSIVAATGYRFVFLGLMAIVQLLVMGRIGFRNDEYTIATSTGLPFGLLVFSQFALALSCWAVIAVLFRRHSTGMRASPVIGGVVLGILSWMTVAYVFDIQMMK
jgi:hypothetical protein